MTTPKIDRRVKRTRKVLLDSLTKLLEEKDLKDITVKEISEYSDLNRGTFYLHYKDVFDMMEQIQAELFDEFNEILSKFSPNGKNDSPYEILYHSFLFLEKNKPIAKVLMGPHGDYQFIMSLRNLVKKHINEVWLKNNFNMEQFEFFYSYCISGILGLIQYWIENDTNKTPEQMAALVTQIILNDPRLYAKKD